MHFYLKLDTLKNRKVILIQIMTTQIKLKDQTFVLPKKWIGKNVLIRESQDAIVIKKIEKPEFWKSWEKMRGVSKGISKKDIQQAVSWSKKS